MMTLLDLLSDDVDMLTILGTGSRVHDNPRQIEKHLHQEIAASSAGLIVVRHGACPAGPHGEGADQAFHRFVETHRQEYALHGRTLLEDPMPADWDSCSPDCPDVPHRKVKHPQDRWHPGVLADYCVKAGPRRNKLMVAKTVTAPGAKVCLAFPHPKSYSGTANCHRLARVAGIRAEWIRYEAVAA